MEEEEWRGPTAEQVALAFAASCRTSGLDPEEQWHLRFTTPSRVHCLHALWVAFPQLGRLVAARLLNVRSANGLQAASWIALTRTRRDWSLSAINAALAALGHPSVTMERLREKRPSVPGPGRPKTRTVPPVRKRYTPSTIVLTTVVADTPSASQKRVPMRRARSDLPSECPTTSVAAKRVEERRVSAEAGALAHAHRVMLDRRLRQHSQPCALFGDPPPGRSALDGFVQQGEPDARQGRREDDPGPVTSNPRGGHRGRVSQDTESQED